MLETLISSPFEAEAYKRWLSSIFTTWNPRTLPAERIDHSHVSSYHALGTTFLDDGRELAIFIFELKDTVDLEHNRVSLHKALESRTKEILADGAIAAFYKPSDPSVWRFSFLRFTYDENDKQIVTASRRFTYLLGNGIAVKTAKEYLKKLVPHDMDKIQDAFSVERVSKEFFEEYRKLFEQVVEHLKPQKGLFDSETDIHAYAKKLLGRIVFLYFLQKKGWMGAKEKDSWGSGDKNFISGLFKDNPRDFYVKRLAPLFFETLNRKRENDYSDIFGSYIPFLNGGLFDERKGLDDRVIINDAIFAEVFGVFDRYNFTVIEDTPHDSEVAIDPEMLGRVFENLLEENYRKGKGAFYTPREIVHYMCRESLIDKLSQSFDPDAIKNLIIHSETDNSYIRKHAKEIETVVKSLKVLDPAIGSGAFPMGLLHELVAVLANLDKTADLAELKRSVIENSIYGVDIDPDAVEIAKLRFWLSLTVDEDTPSPLPNLFFKIMQGNSLIETIDGIDPIPTDLSAPKTKREQKTLLSPIRQAWDFDKVDAHDHILVLTKKLHQFFQASDRELKQGLQEEIFSVIKQILDQRIDELKRNISTLQNDLAVEQTKTKTPIVERKVKKLTDDMFQFESTLVKIEALKNSPISPEIFLYKLWFGEVLKEGGFDIVIGNPPYIRQEAIKHLKPALQKENYTCFNGTADIYVYFYEQGYRLLKEKGILSFITSNKWARAKYGKEFRNFVLENTNMLEYIDFNGVKVFETATVDTNILSFQKINKASDFLYCDVGIDYKGGDLSLYCNQNGFQYGQNNLTSESFVFVNPKEYFIKKRIESLGTPLKNWDIQINYGVKTGFNEAFIISSELRDELISIDPKSADILKPILRGRDIKRYASDWAGLYLIATFPALNLNIDDYPSIKQHLNNFGNRLNQSGEAGSRKKTGNAWFETQDQIAYWREFEHEKIMYPNMTKYRPFFYDKSGFFSNDKSFIINGQRSTLKYLIALLNSWLFDFAFKDKFPELLGGTLELRKVFFEHLPIPKLSDNLQKPFEILVDYILFTKSNEMENESKFFESLIDLMVYGIYFEDSMKAHECYINNSVRELTVPFDEDMNDEQKKSLLSVVIMQLRDDKEISRALIFKNNIEEVQIVEGISND